MDVYKLLKADHLKVKDLFAELEDTTERAVKTRASLFEKLKTELTMHAEAEEACFYPRFLEAGKTHELALEAIEEHKVVKTLLSELESEAKGTEEWAAKLKVLKENVEHHVEEEEGGLFKLGKTILSKEDAEAIAEEIEAFKEKAASMHA